MTVYAAQGSTYNTVVADMQRPPNLDFAKHWLACYAMLSRSNTLEGLLILRPATRRELSAKPPQHLLDEMERLESMEKLTLDELVAYLDSLPIETPEVLRTTVLSKDSVAREREFLKEKRPLRATSPPRTRILKRIR